MNIAFYINNNKYSNKNKKLKNWHQWHCLCTHWHKSCSLCQSLPSNDETNEGTQRQRQKRRVPLSILHLSSPFSPFWSVESSGLEYWHNPFLSTFAAAFPFFVVNMAMVMYKWWASEAVQYTTFSLLPAVWNSIMDYFIFGMKNTICVWSELCSASAGFALTRVWHRL